MKIVKVLCLVAGVTLVAAAAGAQEVTIVSDVLGPQEPLFVDGSLYYVAWISGSVGGPQHLPRSLPPPSGPPSRPATSVERRRP